MNTNRKAALGGALAANLVLIGAVLAIVAGEDQSTAVLAVRIAIAVVSGLVAAGLLLYVIYGRQA